MTTAAAAFNPFQFLRQSWRKRFDYWLERRYPPARNIVLNHNNIFIIPNKQGLGFFIVLALMFIGAINYQINLAFALVFLLLSMFLLTIFHTFRNLAGLHLSAVPGSPVFAGEKAEVVVILNRHGERTYENIEVSYPESRAQHCDLLELQEHRLSLFIPARQRGWLKPGRLRIETTFPFGICKAWSLPDFAMQILVYPRPIVCDLDWLLSNQQHSGNTTLVRGSEDFHSLREYREGDSLRHVAWKILARGQGMYTKEYASTIDEKVWLRWEMFGDLTVEELLSRLCWCVIQLDAAGTEFGIEIPGTCLTPARGPQHYAQVLHALAVFGLPEGGGQ